MDQIQVAASMAGEWWAKRLSNEYADRRPAFSAAVAKRVEKGLRGECHWDWWGERKDGRGCEDHAQVEFDYDPHYCLCEALAEAMPEVPLYKRKYYLPTKHTLDVYVDRLKPKEGYGNWTPDIRVPAAGAA